MNNPAKQDDIVHWHRKIDNLVIIVTKTKLKGKTRLWIINKFGSVQVFTSDMDAGYLDSGHVCKVLDILGQLLSIKLLFKNKLSVSILGLYTRASLAIHFSQTSNINSMIAKAVNEFSFTILGGDFNEDGSHKCASFKKCFNLGLVNSLSGSVSKTIDYVFISSNLVNVILDCGVVDVGDYFDTDHRAVSVSMGVRSLLDIHLFSLHKQANKNHWKYNYRGVDDTK
ncbi:hypothetical protein G9A89_006864 [Geosiphon pyriformis]|nr:hypothetical protein G9A89_006864 [Geosiphon pyriformis]